MPPGGMRPGTRPDDRPARTPRNSVHDRPGRLKLLLRRQRRLLRPLAWSGAVGLVALFALLATHSAEPGGALARLRDRLDRAAGGAGLRITGIKFEGRANTPESVLRAALDARIGAPILGFSVAQAEKRVEALSWVAHATVERRLPGTIVVRLQERRPLAVWQNQRSFVLIDRNGQVVANRNVADFRDLPLVVGPGAPEAAATLIDALNNHPTLARRVNAAVRVGDRRWNLHMKSGMEVMLPEGHVKEALQRLVLLEQQHQLLDRPLRFIDMRLPDMLVLRPITTAAAPASPARNAPGGAHARPADPRKPT